MPRKKRRQRKQSSDYTAGERHHLATGNCWWPIVPGFGDDRRKPFRHDDANKAWGMLKAEILAEWIAEHPGYRPWAWWHLEPRELRQRTDGGIHPCERDPSRKQRCGLPADVGGAADDEWTAEYESVPAYLVRLGLLTGFERDYLADHPEELSPVGACDGLGCDGPPLKELLRQRDAG